MRELALASEGVERLAVFIFYDHLRMGNQSSHGAETAHSSSAVQ